MAANVYEEITRRLLKQSGDELAKAQMTTATMSSASVVELDWAETLEMFGNDETPLVSSLGKTKSKAITHRWREATARAGAANTSNEGAAAEAAVSVAPAAKTNTCQIIKGTIGVSESAITEAQNGIYGTDILDEIAFQLETETVGILKDLETALLFGVLSTTDPRAMKGLVGAPGTWDGIIQTTRKDLSAAAFTETLFKAWLRDIWAQQAGKYPDTVHCSMAATSVINAFTTNYSFNVASATDLASLPAGTRVKQYIAPWGGLLDIYPHPMNTNSATAGNNWMMAVCTPRLKIADFRPLKVRKLTSADVDGENWEVILEATLEARVEKSHGIARNFAQIT
jgi:hypothetical protein